MVVVFEVFGVVVEKRPDERISVLSMVEHKPVPVRYVLITRLDGKSDNCLYIIAK